MKVRACCAEVAEVLDHLRRPRRAVETDDVGAHGLERGERRADLRADEHAPGRLDRDLDHQRDADAGGCHRPAGRDHRRLALEEVLDRLDEDDVGAAFEQALHLGDVGVAQLGELDVAERRELGAGADGADDPAGPVGRRVARGDLAGEGGGGAVQVAGDLGDVVLGQDDRERPEGGRLDRVDADGEELVVHLADEVGAGEDEVLVAPLEGGAAEVVGAEIVVLGPGAERAVEDEDAVAESVEEGRHRPDRLPGTTSRTRVVPGPSPVDAMAGRRG